MLSTVESESSLNGKRILLVEDSEDNQILISEFLRRMGAMVEVAPDGEIGVSKALNGEYDAVLMDIHMPRLDGLQATHQLRKAGFRQPILAITAHALEETRKKALEMGCNDHLTKPIDRERLIESIKRHLKN